jgi:N-formylglutamate deformylase
MSATYTLHPGSTPLLISMPHVGTQIPPDLAPHYTPRALLAEDTDWHLDRLYAFAKDMGASLIVPLYSRYVIDLNRSGDNTPLYPGQNNTELCPTRHFSGEPIYREGHAPNVAEIQRRVTTYWQPYHDSLHSQLQKLKASHGHAVLLDAHSIKSTLPWLFEGELPHLNLGTVSGQSCAPGLRHALTHSLQQHPEFSHVVDGRFKGGHITRHFGQPQQGVHAVQLEMSWRTYMQEEPAVWDDTRAAKATPMLRALVQTLLAWRPS